MLWPCLNHRGGPSPFWVEAEVASPTWMEVVSKTWMEVVSKTWMEVVSKTWTSHLHLELGC